MKKTMKMNLWFLKKLYQYDKKRFGGNSGADSYSCNQNTA